MSVMVVIVIVVLVGIVISISSSDDYEGADLVNIITSEADDIATEPVFTIHEFVGLDMSVGGYRVVSKMQTSELDELIYEEVGGQYNLLTKTLNQDSVLLVKDFWQDKDSGGQKLMKMEIATGELDEVLKLPNTKVGDLARFITSAVYSPDNNFIAYSVYVFDIEIIDGVGKEGPEYIEIWEYDIVKDIHTLITQIDGGLYMGVNLIGYDSEKKYLIVYQYVGDGPGASFGATYFVNLEDQSIDKITLKTAIERFSKYDKENVPPLGLPYLSSGGEYLAFLLPVGLYYGGEGNVATPVLLYSTKTHEFTDLYQYDKFVLGGEAQDWQEVYGIRWGGDGLYIATDQQVLEYNVTTTKLRPLYEWSDGYQERYSVFASNDDGLIISMESESLFSYVDFTKAEENELNAWQNFEYINIY